MTTDKKPVGVNVLDIIFYKYDEDGNDILNKNGTLKKFRLKSSRCRPLEYFCETISIDDVEESKWPIELNKMTYRAKPNKNKFIKKTIKGIEIDVRSKSSLYITIGKWVIYIDNSTGEQIIESWID